MNIRFESRAFLLSLGVLLFGFMTIAEATTSYDDPLEQTEISKYEEIVRREPENSDALVKLANLLYSHHLSGEAAPLWRKAILINPSLVAPHWSLGVVYGQRGDIDAAKTAYLKALRLDPGHISSRFNLAAIYRKKGELDSAENEYRTILKMRPDEGRSAHHGLGQVLADEKRWSEAIEQYRMAQMNGGSLSAIGIAIFKLDLAEALRSTGKFDEAAKENEHAQRFLDIRMRSPEGAHWRPPANLIAKANFELACIRAQQKRMPESVRALASAISYDPSMLEKMEKSGVLKKVHTTKDYKKLVSEVLAQRKAAPLVLEARFTARIKWIELIGKREINVLIAEADARWLVAIEIRTIERPGILLDTPGEIILAIHSPARLLARSEKTAPEKSYGFQVRGEVREGKSVYYWVQAHELPLN